MVKKQAVTLLLLSTLAAKLLVEASAVLVVGAAVPASNHKFPKCHSNSSSFIFLVPTAASIARDKHGRDGSSILNPVS